MKKNNLNKKIESRNARKKSNFPERKAESLISTKLIIIILCVLVLLVVAFSLANPFILNWMKNLPGSSYNDTDKVINSFTSDQIATVTCDKLVGNIGTAEGGNLLSRGKQFLYISGKKTNLYVDTSRSSEIVIRLLHDDEFVASATNKIIVVSPSLLDQYSQNFKELGAVGLPSIQDLELIQNSIIISGNNICKTNKGFEQLKENINCVATCALYDGQCSSTVISGKVANGKLDCKDNELCYVSASESSLALGNFNIKQFRVYDPAGTSHFDLEYPTNSNVANIDLYPGQRITFTVIASFGSSYCLFFDSDLQFIEASYNPVTSTTNSNVALIPTKQFFYNIDYSGEKLFEFVAFDPNNPSTKVIRRVNVVVSNKFPNGYDPGKIVLDSQLKETAANSQVGDFFYIFNVEKFWSGGSLFTDDYRINVLKGGQVDVYAFDKNKTEWHMLDCNLGFFTYYKDVSINNLESSLTATFAKDKCAW